MLSRKYSREAIRNTLIARSDWKPFPAVDDRSEWEGLPGSLKRAHIELGEQACGRPWPALPASLYMDFARTGNRSRYQEPYGDRRTAIRNLALAECIENKGRFADAMADGIWAVCEESSWVIPAHCYLQESGKGLPDVSEPAVDLFAAETSALLSWILYLLAPRLDQVSPLIARRIGTEIQSRILTPLLNRSDFWWMGFSGQRVNNWNPWIVSNWISSALLIERDEERRIDHVAKAMAALDNFMSAYPDDGGCDEGPGYWGRAGGSLFDCLDLLCSATAGAVNVCDDPLVKAIGRFIYRVRVADGYFINFADASPHLTPSASVCFGFGKRIGDAELRALGSWAAGRQRMLERGSGECMGRALRIFSFVDEIANDHAAPALPRDAFFNRIEVFIARDRKNCEDGFFVAAKGGHNAESHNHNDVGNFIVYRDGKPVLVDAGVEAYTAKTFSPDRYTIWTMQSAYHSVPMVNGIMQAAGREFAARNVTHSADDRAATFSMDIAKAYPEEAGIKSWIRTITLERGESVAIADRFELAAPPREAASHLLAAGVPGIQEPGVIRIEPAALAGDRVSGSATLNYDPDVFEVVFEPVSLADSSLKSAWGCGLTRIALKWLHPAASGEWVLRVTP